MNGEPCFAASLPAGIRWLISPPCPFLLEMSLLAGDRRHNLLCALKRLDAASPIAATFSPPPPRFNACDGDISPLRCFVESEIPLTFSGELCPLTLYGRTKSFDKQYCRCLSPTAPLEEPRCPFFINPPAQRWPPVVRKRRFGHRHPVFPQ